MPPALEIPHGRQDVKILDATLVPPILTSAAVPPEASAGGTLQIPDASVLSERLTKLSPSRRPACRSLTNRYRPLPKEALDDSVSIGSAVTGRLHAGKLLARSGRGYRVLPRTLLRGFFHGTSELVAAIVRAGRVIDERLPGSHLGVGNLSRSGGGDIPQSRSHNSGRDVDIAFFVVDSLGRSVIGREFVDLNAAGASEGEGVPVFFDAHRNWEFVRAILLDSTIQVQYIFIADWLRTRIIDHARQVEPDSSLVCRAEEVLRQPLDSSPHADHFHVRIHCDLHDRLRGCRESGARHAWVERFNDAIQAHVNELIDRYQEGSEEERSRVLEELNFFQQEEGTDEQPEGEERP
jgi:penicillin-insensitive murein endopeptidase